MDDFVTMGMRLEGGRFQILDQTRLPHEKVWLDCNDTASLLAIIDRLAIRGAPAIGLSVCVLLALLAEKGMCPEEFEDAATALQNARPTAVNVVNYLKRLREMAVADYPASVVCETQKIMEEDERLCERMGALGSQLIADGETLLTHCNTGGLATAGIGTAMGVIRTAHESGKRIRVIADETRPLLQGGRLTAWECGELNIPHEIICDSAAAMLMRQGRVDKVLVGSDRIAVNGDFANKIGTYSLAVLAHYHAVPFYVVAPHTTIDPECLHGDSIIIEERAEDEVKGAKGEGGYVRWAPEKSPVCNPAFDVTPAELVTGWILDTGIFSQEDLGRTNWWLGSGGR